MRSASDQERTHYVYASTLSIAFVGHVLEVDFINHICKMIMLSINFAQTSGPTTVKISSDMGLF